MAHGSARVGRRDLTKMLWDRPFSMGHLAGPGWPVKVGHGGWRHLSHLLDSGALPQPWRVVWAQHVV